MSRDKASEQLKEWADKNTKKTQLTTASGWPIGDKLNSLTVGKRGPILLQDVVLLDELAHFDAERIPERVVHAKGAGAHGEFEVTSADITKYCKSAMFSEVGKKTPVFARFSTVGGEKGSPDTVRDPRGFAVKFYTEEGNWDLAGNNTPIFFIRDPFLFPSFLHTQKRNPVTNLKDMDMFWDFLSLRPESMHQVMILFSDRGTPKGYRHMNGYGSHTFKLVNKDGDPVYCKFHLKTDQGIVNFHAEEAEKMTSKDPDYSTRDLYNAIAEGKFPSWTLYIQVMTFKEAESYKFNPFDLTKVWSQKDFPLIKVGVMKLNKNPVNYFQEVEQFAASPANLIPGIEVSPDKMLQARLFSYPDTHRHRLGVNWEQIRINRPLKNLVHNYQRDGFMFHSEGDEDAGAPNYYPNSFSGPTADKKYKESVFTTTGDVQRYESGDEDNFTQPGILYRQVLTAEQKDRLASNIAGSLSKAQKFIQDRAIKNFSQVDKEFGDSVKSKLTSLTGLVYLKLDDDSEDDDVVVVEDEDKDHPPSDGSSCSLN